MFGELPAGPPPPQAARPEPPQKGERRVVVEGPGETAYVEVAYHAPAASDPDFFPMIVLDSILAGPSNFNMFSGGISNKTSRLYRALVETELAAGVSGGLAATLDPYLYSITATVRNGKTPEQVLAALDAEMRKMMETPVTARRWSAPSSRRAPSSPMAAKRSPTRRSGWDMPKYLPDRMVRELSFLAGCGDGG